MSGIIHTMGEKVAENLKIVTIIGVTALALIVGIAVYWFKSKTSVSA
jgi:hypothetical protein